MHRFLKKCNVEQAQRLAMIQEVFILAGCSNCGRRLVHDGEPLEGVRIIYDSGRIGTPLCASCFEILACDHN